MPNKKKLWPTPLLVFRPRPLHTMLSLQNEILNKQQKKKPIQKKQTQTPILKQINVERTRALVKFVSGHVLTLSMNLSRPDVSKYELLFPDKQ